MFTISLHGIFLHAKIGLYPEEKIYGNDFEVDVDVTAEENERDSFPYIDYAVLYEIVTTVFQEEGSLLETFARMIHHRIRQQFPDAGKVRVAIRKLQPPLSGEVRYSQVCYET